MALDGDVLGAAMAAQFGTTDATAIENYKIMARLIVEHIKTFGLVTVAVTGVATGAMGGGPGVPVAGTGTGTIA